MPRRRLVLLVFLGLCACSRPTEPTTTSFIVDGLQVIFKYTPGNPVVAGGFYLKGGTNYIGLRQAGIERLLFQASIQGTENWPKDKLNAALESMGTFMGAVSYYDFNGLAFLAQGDYFGSTWDIFMDVLLQPRLDNYDLALVRENLIATIESQNDNPAKSADRVANDLFYQGHPYGVSVFGVSSVIGRLSRKDLIEYHRNDVVRNRALLVVVGDLDQRELTIKTRQLARQLPLGPELRLPALGFDPGAPDIALARRNLATRQVRALFTAPSPGHSDYPAFTAAMNILSARITEKLEMELGIATQSEAGWVQRLANHGYFRFATARPDSAVRVVFRIIDDLIRDPIPQNQLQNALAVSTTRHLLQNESAYNQLTQLTVWEIAGGGWEQMYQYLPEVRSLQPADIQAVVRKYVRNLHFAVVGDSRRINQRLLKSR